jgi:prepilin-type processing-associated H-X9-DG protein
MKPRPSNQTNRGLMLVEVLVVIIVLAVLVAVLLPALAKAKRKSSRIGCVNCLKEIGLAYRFWEGDNGDKYPMFVSVTNGGAMELIATGNVAACFQVMSNELSTPKILVCPVDVDRIAATNFTVDFNNSNISYFVGLNATDTQPQVFLSGDDNFVVDDVPVKSGLLELSRNSPIAWGSGRHVLHDLPFWTSMRNKLAGNIGFADGSVKESFNRFEIYSLANLLRQTGLATNRVAIP